MWGCSIRARAWRSDSKRARTLRESIPRLISFERRLAADRAELLGEEDGAHAPLADLLAELVAIGDDRIDEARAVVLGSIDGGAVVPVLDRGGRRDGAGGVGGLGIGDEGPIQGGGRCVVGGQQSVQPAAQLGMLADLGVEERPAVGGVGPLDGRQEQGFDSLGIGRHASVSGTGCFPT